MNNRQKLLHLARFLRKHAPPPIPVKMHLVSALIKCSGMATIGPKYGHIYIDIDRDINTQLDTLVHEWAHIRIGWKIKEHTQEFWLDHGRIYEIFLKWCDSGV